jgi:dolichol-phosphate mannosyltransferase
MRTLSIVIPCYNERAHVGELISRVFAVTLPEGWEREVIVVDDASTDGTPDVLRALTYPLRLVFLKRNGGKGSALRAGFALATGSHVLIQDADLEYDPNDIPRLLAVLGDEKTVVYGSRYLEKGGGRGSLLLRAGVGFLSFLTGALYGKRLTDVNTCYKLFPMSAAHIFPEGGFEADGAFASLLLRRGYDIREVPISYAPRTAAEGKKLKFHVGWATLVAILRYRFAA